ncbi:MAG: sugar transferase [Acidobacteriota bacterium]|nr:sugar transferase [Acidobacteriota bacterium]
MLGQEARQSEYLQSILDGLLLCLAFFLAFVTRSYGPLLYQERPEVLDLFAHIWLLALAVPMYWALDRRVRRPAPGGTRPLLVVIRRVTKPFLYQALFLGTTIFLLQAKSFSRAVFFMFLGYGLVLLVIAHWIGFHAGRRKNARADRKRHLLVVGVGHDAMAMRRLLDTHPEFRLRVVGHLRSEDEVADEGAVPILGELADLKAIIETEVVDEVLFVVSPEVFLRCHQEIAWCEEVGVTVHIKVDFVRTLLARAYPTELDGMPMLTFASTPRDAFGLLLKRCMDIGISAALLIAISPIMLATVILVKTTSRGPALFRQARLGLNGRKFQMLKFRSMYIDAENRRAELEAQNEMQGPVFKIAADPRITPIGRLIRKFSIDELPQLWNILRGEMSLVGPRPPLGDEVQLYERWQRRRLSMKPGLTCLWQVNGRNRILFDDWMKLDLEYIDNWSLALDLRILLRTIPAVVLARGAR